MAGEKRFGTGYPLRHRLDGLLSSVEVCRQSGITSRQLDYWIRARVIDLPEQKDVGSGGRRRFTNNEADAICAIAAEKRELDKRQAAWSSGEFWHAQQRSLEAVAS